MGGPQRSHLRRVPQSLRSLQCLRWKSIEYDIIGILTSPENHIPMNE